jgi:putative SOS response-associated peptidase YedK
MFKWGFVPLRAQDDDGTKPVNARTETVATTPLFSESFRRRRCIISADGFYEWRTVNKKKLPVHFHLKTNELFEFAGVWDVWGKGRPGDFTTLTLACAHRRMEVRLTSRLPRRLLSTANQSVVRC